jgi:hypothetical protein
VESPGHCHPGSFDSRSCNAYVSWQNSRAGLDVETFKAEAARIFEVVKTGNPDVAAKNLSFLLESGLIQSDTIVTNIRNYLKERRSGEGVSLPAVPSSADCRKKVFDQLASKLSKNLTQDDAMKQFGFINETADRICLVAANP